jgi:hypothetical protein
LILQHAFSKVANQKLENGFTILSVFFKWYLGLRNSMKINVPAPK